MNSPLQTLTTPSSNQLHLLLFSSACQFVTAAKVRRVASSFLLLYLSLSSSFPSPCLRLNSPDFHLDHQRMDWKRHKKFCFKRSSSSFHLFFSSKSSFLFLVLLCLAQRLLKLSIRSLGPADSVFHHPAWIVRLRFSLSLPSRSSNLSTRSSPLLSLVADDLSVFDRKLSYSDIPSDFAYARPESNLKEVAVEEVEGISYSKSRVMQSSIKRATKTSERVI